MKGVFPQFITCEGADATARGIRCGAFWTKVGAWRTQGFGQDARNDRLEAGSTGDVARADGIAGRNAFHSGQSQTHSVKPHFSPLLSEPLRPGGRFWSRRTANFGGLDIAVRPPFGK